MEFFKNYFETLGISSTTRYKEGMRAYMRLVKQFKPETSPEKFQEISEAWQVVKNFLPKDEVKKSQEATTVEIELYEHSQAPDAQVKVSVEEVSSQKPVELVETTKKSNAPIIITEVSEPSNYDIVIEEEPVQFETTKRFSHVDFGWLNDAFRRSFDPEPIRQVFNEQVLEILEKETNLDPLILTLIQNMAIRSYAFGHSTYFQYYLTKLSTYQSELETSGLGYDQLSFNHKQRLFEEFRKINFKKAQDREALGVILLNDANVLRLEGNVFDRGLLKFVDFKVGSIELTNYYKDFFHRFNEYARQGGMTDPQGPRVIWDAGEKPKSKKRSHSVYIYYLIGFLLLRLFVYVIQESSKTDHSDYSQFLHKTEQNSSVESDKLKEQVEKILNKDSKVE